MFLAINGAPVPHITYGLLSNKFCEQELVIPMTRALRKILPIAILATGVLSACGPDNDSAQLNAGQASITLNSKAALTFTLGDDEHVFRHIANCTISPLLSGVAAWEKEPDFDSTEFVAMLRISAITDGATTGGGVEVNFADVGYAFEGPIRIVGKTLSWSGQFKKYDRTTLPKPPLEVGEVAGAGKITC